MSLVLKAGMSIETLELQNSNDSIHYEVEVNIDILSPLYLGFEIY